MEVGAQNFAKSRGFTGSPLGTVGPGRPVVSIELRRDGEPVNPLDFAKF